jgi:hypothetical protein
MFCRVLQGFSIETLRGVWMRVDDFPYTNNQYYVVQKDGVITETSEFGTRVPAGFCTLLTTNWYATNFNYSVTMLYEGQPGSVFEARFGTADYFLGPGIGWRRVGPTACAGFWFGRLIEDASVPNSSQRSVNFVVDENGWIDQVEGLPEQVVGRLYGLELRSTPGELKAAGTLSSGDPGPYGRVHLSGRILDSVFQGVFWTADDSVRGTVELQRLD